MIVSGSNKAKLAELKDENEKVLSKIKKDHQTAMISARRKSGSFVDPPPIDPTSGSNTPEAGPKLINALSAPEVLKALPGYYGSNERLAQRRRIYLTEMLVDIGPEALGAIELVLNDPDEDFEPDINADRLRRTAERFGVAPEKAEQLSALMKEMQPKLAEERSQRWEAWGEKMAEFRKTQEGLPDEERRRNFREFFEQAREERENAPQPTEGAQVELMERTKAIVGDAKYTEMEEKRPGTVRRLMDELGGRTRGSTRGRGSSGGGRPSGGGPKK